MGAKLPWLKQAQELKETRIATEEPMREKCKLENKTKAICQLGNKTTKAKQTNKHNEEKREKERKRNKG